ncbi:MAG: hypothetical protein JJE52_12405 [Acidimicrobiia bacterium]|nr:hypothetical protein [Acidimicrobiia bacterium]
MELSLESGDDPTQVTAATLREATEDDVLPHEGTDVAEVRYRLDMVERP